MLARCTHELTAGGFIHGLNAASRAGFARMVTRDTGNVLDLFVLSLVAVRRFVSPHIEEACERSRKNVCLRDILVRSGSRHLVDLCTWLHAHQAIRLRD